MLQRQCAARAGIAWRLGTPGPYLARTAPRPRSSEVSHRSNRASLDEVRCSVRALIRDSQPGAPVWLAQPPDKRGRQSPVLLLTGQGVAEVWLLNRCCPAYLLARMRIAPGGLQTRACFAGQSELRSSKERMDATTNKVRSSRERVATASAHQRGGHGRAYICAGTPGRADLLAASLATRAAQRTHAHRCLASARAAAACRAQHAAHMDRVSPFLCRMPRTLPGASARATATTTCA